MILKPAKHKTLFVSLALVVITIVAFEPIRKNDFINFDDETYVTNNFHVTGGITRPSVVWAFTTFHMGHWHPLTWLSHMLDCQLFGLNPLSHHLHSVLLHLINVLLLFAVLRRMTGAFWRCAFVAAAFALHPLRVESVAWVSDRKDLLSTVFWMLTTLAYLRYVRKPGVWIYLVMISFFILGLLAKAMLVTLPFVLLLLDYWPLGRFSRARRDLPSSLEAASETAWSKVSIYRLIGEKLPMILFVPVSAVIGGLAQKLTGAMMDVDLLPMTQRITNAFVYYVRYLGKICYPHNLSVLYILKSKPYPTGQVMICLLLLVVITGLVIYFRRGKPYLVVGWLWFLGVMLPVIGLAQSGPQAIADRYTYLPSIGIFIMLSWGIEELMRKWRYRKIVLGFSATIVIVAMVIGTRLRMQMWKNGIVLCSQAIKVDKDNYVMHYNLGISYQRHERLDEAIDSYRQALKLRPLYDDALNNLAVVLSLQNKNSEAVKYLDLLLQIKPDLYEAHNNLGCILRGQNRLEEAISQYTQAIKIKPDYLEAICNLGNLLQSMGKTSQAIDQYHQALGIRPDYIPARCNLADVLQAQGNLDEAIKQYRIILRLKPDHIESLSNLGAALAMQGKLSEAITIFESVIKMQPDNINVHMNLGYAFQLQGNLDGAINQYQQVLRLAPDDAEAYQNLSQVMKHKNETKNNNK